MGGAGEGWGGVSHIKLTRVLSEIFQKTPRRCASRLAMPHGLICQAAHFPFVSMERTSPAFAVFSLKLNLAPFLFKSKHATVNKRDNRKDQIFARVNATRPKSRKDRSKCSTEQTLQTPTKKCHSEH